MNIRNKKQTIARIVSGIAIFISAFYLQGKIGFWQGFLIVMGLSITNYIHGLFNTKK